MGQPTIPDTDRRHLHDLRSMLAAASGTLQVLEMAQQDDTATPERRRELARRAADALAEAVCILDRFEGRALGS